ncbi:3-dehydroquinate dehydratase [Taibaiella sp. KBW10]|uniref:type II 3-dehydroquinate dehydratase n=1 Tax=Taibaiella sp. KBW10 TaxID=2153357 RepID=UPI000F5942F9|nr:type II 3-dehydroquinate dehydratase [Taibaiella sp. KBW10]RQO31022.1 3-dehydroquinate dehydratase [Taibaiella sp. KBW10]
MKIKIMNGPNLNLLGTRQPELYGSTRFEDYFATLSAHFPEVTLSYFQSNHEGALIDELQLMIGQYDGLILNPAAYGHTSIALADALACLDMPIIEVHISDIYQREAYRQHTYTAAYAQHMITGKGLEGYKEAIEKLLRKS